MQKLDEIRIIIRKNRDFLAAKYGVAVVGVFGSYVRGEQRESSDIDFLVDILRPISLLEIVGAEIYLSEILGIKVDLVPKRDVQRNCAKVSSRKLWPYDPPVTKRSPSTSSLLLRELIGHVLQTDFFQTFPGLHSGFSVPTPQFVELIEHGVVLLFVRLETLIGSGLDFLLPEPWRREGRLPGKDRCGGC